MTRCPSCADRLAVMRVRLYDINGYAEADVCNECADRLAGEYPDNIEKVADL